MLDRAGGHGKIDHIHRFEFVHHRVDQSGGESVAAADPVEDVEGEKPAFEGMIPVPHESLEGVFTARISVAHMARDAFQIGIAFREMLEDFILLFVIRLHGKAVFPVAGGWIRLIFIQVIWLDPEQDVHVGKTLCAVVAGLFPGPEPGTEIPVKTDSESQFFGGFQHIQDQLRAARTEGGRDSGQVEPVKAGEQGFQIIAGEVILRDRAVLPVIGNFGGADSVTGFKVVGSQSVRRGFLRTGQDDRRAVDVVGPEPADGAFSEGVVGDDAEKGTVDPQICQRQGDIRFASAVTGVELGSHADLFIIWRSQAQHDLTGSDESLCAAFLLEKRITVFHFAVLPVLWFLIEIIAERVITVLFPYCDIPPGQDPSEKMIIGKEGRVKETLLKSETSARENPMCGGRDYALRPLFGIRRVKRYMRTAEAFK